MGEVNNRVILYCFCVQFHFLMPDLVAGSKSICDEVSQYLSNNELIVVDDKTW